MDVWKTFPSENDRFAGWAKRMGELQMLAYQKEFNFNNYSVEDYVLASLSWVAKKKLPILFVVEDNNFAVLTKKEDRRDWSAKKVAEAFKIKAHDINDDPVKIYKTL